MKYYRTKDVIKKYAEKIANDAYCDYGVGNGKPNKEDMNISTDFFSEVPTVEIVTCEECIRAKTWNCPFYRAGYTYKADNFCADGERKNI